jgi:hypothetical protein
MTTEIQQKAAAIIAEWRQDPVKGKLFSALLRDSAGRPTAEASAMAQEIYRGDIGAPPANVALGLIQKNEAFAQRVIELDAITPGFSHADADAASSNGFKHVDVVSANGMNINQPLSELQQQAIAIARSWEKDPTKNSYFTALLREDGKLTNDAARINLELYDGDHPTKLSTIALALIAESPVFAQRVVDADTLGIESGVLQELGQTGGQQR